MPTVAAAAVAVAAAAAADRCWCGLAEGGARVWGLAELELQHTLPQPAGSDVRALLAMDGEAWGGRWWCGGGRREAGAKGGEGMEGWPGLGESVESARVAWGARETRARWHGGWGRMVPWWAHVLRGRAG